MLVFQKLEGKTTTLNFWNQKNGRKFYYSQKLCFDRIWNQKNGKKFYYSQKLCFDKIFAWKEYNFPSGFLTNTILNFAQECVRQIPKNNPKREKKERIKKKFLLNYCNMNSFELKQCLWGWKSFFRRRVANGVKLFLK